MRLPGHHPSDASAASRSTPLPEGVVAAESVDGVEVRFAGRGLPTELESAARTLAPDDVEVAWGQQIHSADVLEARPGLCGPGDALVTSARRLALAIVTADCVPVLLATPGAVAAVHAGWRGVVAGVVPAALDRLRCVGAGDPGSIRAWIGPSIGVSSYEVSVEVGDQIERAAGPTGSPERPILVPGSRGRPHADLAAAVERQLAQGGIDSIETIELCTFTEAATLHSFRRDGAGAGRNVSVIWRA